MPLVVMAMTIMLSACGTVKTENTSGITQEERAVNSIQAAVSAKEFSANEDVKVSVIGAESEEESEEIGMKYDFTAFTNVEITGVDISSLSEVEQSVLYRAAQYCQAMTDADIDTMREIVSEDMTFTHMSGMRQTREEYFADIANGRLNYFTIDIENPRIAINDDIAEITYTSVLNANAYGARGTYRMKGTHRYELRDGEWIAINR